ncbi:NAD(P)-binding protein [Lentithecium fluviatile CBS 122367]|uniref:NAD(P)-binding protein n=1 Tax=Lentithecium fluviatile CBS 122367 TaxID=1168545 RepID=A0A6G1J1X0_9PLEO|nr:NAD(P)-binding protein [Lentithecium fluviatile CBS 122367]
MSAYAILGATGNTGLEILRCLTKSPNNTIHALVRSQSKLERLFPDTSATSNLKIFQGSISDIDTLSQYLSGTKAAFLTVAVTENIPGCSIAYDTACAVVSALGKLREEDPNVKPPRLIILSSASLDDKFWRDVPGLVHSMLWKTMSNFYRDLATAEAYLRKQSDFFSSRLTCVFMMPGGLLKDEPKGHELGAERQQTFVSFSDLAAAMVEAADEESDRWDGAHASVMLANGRKARIEWWAGLVLFKGLLCHFFPWTYPYLGFINGL